MMNKTNREIEVIMLYNPGGGKGSAQHFISMGVNENGNLSICNPPLWNCSNLIYRVLRMFFVGWMPLTPRLLEILVGRKGYVEMVNELKRHGECSLVFFEVTNINLMKAIKRILPPNVVCCYNYFGNIMKPVFHTTDQNICKKVIAMKRLGVKVATFDERDATKYGMEYAGQFYKYVDASENDDIEFDFFFCGMPKDREADLNRLKQKLEAMGYRCKYVIPHAGSKGITYDENISYIRKSRCIIDWVASGQQGMTRRPLEALFFKKKMITNLCTLQNVDFYKESNILINPLAKNPQEIKDFMDAPYTDVDEQIANKYDVNEWAKQFLPTPIASDNNVE